MFRKTLLLLALLVTFFATVPMVIAADGGVAVATAPVAAPMVLAASTEMDPNALLTSFFKAVETKNLRLAMAPALIALLWLLRKYGAPLFAKLKIDVHTDRGAAIFSLATGTLTWLSATLSTGQSLNMSMVVKSLEMGIMALGGFSFLKKMIAPDPEQTTANLKAAEPPKVA